MEHISIIAQLAKKTPTAHTGTIIIRGYYRRRAVASKGTGYRCDLEHWDHLKRRVSPTMPNADLINSMIDGKIQAMERQLMKKQIMGAPVNRAQLKKAVKGLDDSSDFLAFCRERIKAEYTSDQTLRTYYTECSKLEKFQDVIAFADIGYEFLCNYKMHMVQKLGNKDNTVWKSFKFINTMVRKAVKIGGIIDHNPFDEFNRGNYTQIEKVGMDITHCDAIEKICKDASHPLILRQVGMYMLLMAYSGMRFGDAMRFDPDVNLLDGRFIMDYQKAKTSVNFEAHRRLVAVIDLVRTNRLTISLRRFNDWARVIGTMAGVQFDLTSHRGRHTLGGLLAEMEVPVEQAQVILGHKDIRSTRIYYHHKTKTIDRAVRKIDTL